jgi:hypothetical protein
MLSQQKEMRIFFVKSKPCQKMAKDNISVAKYDISTDFFGPFHFNLSSLML